LQVNHLIPLNQCLEGAVLEVDLLFWFFQVLFLQWCHYHKPRKQLQVIQDPPRKGLLLFGKDLCSHKPRGDMGCVIGASVFDAPVMAFYVIFNYSKPSIPKVQYSRTTIGRSSHSPACHPTMVCCIKGTEVTSHEDNQAASPVANFTQWSAEGSKTFHEKWQPSGTAILDYYNQAQSSRIISFSGFVSLFCSGQTSDEALVKYAAPFVKRKEFFVDWLANCCVKNDILPYLWPLGMWKCTQGLKDWSRLYACYMET